MKVLVTGGAGFIGSNIVDALLNCGHEVSVIDNLSTGNKEFLNRKASFFNIDLRDKNINEVFAEVKPDIVLHHAAQIDIQKSVTHPFEDASINIQGTISILDQCKVSNVKKIIYASSAAVYGNPISLPITEEHPQIPLSNYGISKYVPEHYIRVYSQLYGLDFTILRYSNVFGVRQDPKGEGGVISIFLDRVLNNEDLIVFGDGRQTRDFIYVKDVVKANLSALNLGSRSTFNISTNIQISINELINLLKEISRKEITAIYKEPRKGDIADSLLNNNRAIMELNWEPEYRLKDALRETYDYYRNRKNT